MLRLVRVSLHALSQMDFGEKAVLCIVVLLVLYILFAAVVAVSSLAGSLG